MAYELWDRKYKPKTFDEVMGLDPHFIATVKRDMPHLLLHGLPGVGKTSLADVIIKANEFECLRLNASDERGIDIVREKVKTFAQSKSINGKLRIVFLDEADSLTTAAQDSLRNTMETYQPVCRFILTANYPHKISDAIKDRCLSYECSKPDRDMVFNRLKFIVMNEDANIGDEKIHKVIDLKYPSIRGMIKTLQQLYLNPDLVLRDEQNEDAVKVWNRLKAGKFYDARQVYLDAKIPPEELIKVLYDFVCVKQMPEEVYYKCVEALSECQRHIGRVAFDDIEVERMMALLVQKVKE